MAKAVTMSPVRMELSADPGNTTNGVIKIYNDEKIDRTLYLSAQKFENKDESGQPQFVPNATDGLAKWISIQDSIQVPALDAREVPFTINIPANVDPGGYFAAIFASVVPPKNETNISLQNDVGTLILFRVNGQFPEGETILEFGTKDKNHIYNHLPVEFYFRFQNSGKDRVLPLGDITIRNTFGQVTKVVSSNRGAGNVLPESIRRYESAWVTGCKGKVENYDGEVKQPQFNNFIDAVKYQWENFALGRYSAELGITVNNDAARHYVKSTSFWIIPWQLLLVILGILLLFITPLLILFIVIGIFIRRNKKRQAPTSRGGPTSVGGPTINLK